MTYTPTVELVFIIAQPTWTVEFEFIAQSRHIPRLMSGSLLLNRHENVDLENLMRTYTPTDEWEFIAQLALKTTTWIPRPFSWRLLLNRNDRQQQQQQQQQQQPGNNS